MHAMIIVIYVNCLNYLGYHICNKQKNKKLGTFAVCKYHGIRQRNQPLPCARHRWHTANVPRHVRQPCKKVYCGSARAHGKASAVCPIYCTRQRGPLPMAVCRVPFAVCGTLQTFCRGLLGLCRVPLAHDKRVVSRSEPSWPGCDGALALCKPLSNLEIQVDLPYHPNF